MGVVKGISATEFPRQSDWVGKEVNVCFNYDTSQSFPGKIIRDDSQLPGLTIIQLGDGRILLGTECQFSISSKSK